MAAAWSDDVVPDSLAGATVSMNVDFVAAARGVDLLATATAVRRGRSLCFCEVTVTDPDDRVIAKGLAVHRYGWRHGADRPGRESHTAGAGWRRFSTCTTSRSSGPGSRAAPPRRSTGGGALDVVLLEKDADPAAYKTVCTTFIQASATPVIQRLGLAPRLDAAGGGPQRRSRSGRAGAGSARSRTGRPGARRTATTSAAQTLDPMLRDLAAETPGVELRRGYSVNGLLREGERVTGVVARSATARRTSSGRGWSSAPTAAPRGSPTSPALRGQAPPARPDRLRGPLPRRPAAPGQRSQMWMLDPDVAYIFPHDDDVTILAAMPSKARLDEFRADAEAALAAHLRGPAGRAADDRPGAGLEACSAAST